MAELLERALGIAERARAGEAVEVVLGRSRETEVVAYHGEVESLTRAETAAVGVRVIVGGRVGFATAGSLESSALADALRRARENAELVEADPDAVLAAPDGVPAAALVLRDPEVASTPIEDKVARALELERRVAEHDARIRDVQHATYGDVDGEVAIASTTGIAAQVAQSRAWLFVEALAAADGGPLSTGFASEAARGPAGLDPVAVASDAAERALRGIGADKPTSRPVAVLFTPRTAATLLGLWAGAASGLAVVRGRSMFTGRLGERIAPRWFSLVDDPTDPRSLGASPIDGEGLASRVNRIIDGGVLAELLYDAYAARLAGRSSNAAALRGPSSLPAPGARALRVVAPTVPVEELRSGGEVLVVEALSGVHSGVSTVSGDFSVGVEGVLWVGGAPVEPVREATVSGNLQRMLLDLVGVGDDARELPSGTRAPSLLVEGLQLAGR